MPPLRFRLAANPATGRPAFECDLACARCAAQTQAGARCRRSTCKYLPYCPSHLRSVLHLEVRAVPGMGEGLFAAGGGGPPPQPVQFRPGDLIAPLEGEVLTPAQLAARYRGETPPYGVQGGAIHDGACRRAVGQYANTRVRAHQPHRVHGGACNAWIRMRNRDLVGAPAPNPRPWLVATRVIRQGSEIIADYGPGNYLPPGQTFATMPAHTTRR